MLQGRGWECYEHPAMLRTVPPLQIAQNVNRDTVEKLFSLKTDTGSVSSSNHLFCVAEHNGSVMIREPNDEDLPSPELGKGFNGS